MSDEQLTRHLGRPVVNGRTGPHHVFNHRWDDPSTFVELGTIPAREIADLTGGRLEQDVHVALNRLVVEYDHVLICGPVFPHEVVGYSGGTKYLFPGIAAPPIIHFTHWLGALITSYEVIGTTDTPVRAVIDRAKKPRPTVGLGRLLVMPFKDPTIAFDALAEGDLGTNLICLRMDLDAAMLGGRAGVGSSGGGRGMKLVTGGCSGLHPARSMIAAIDRRFIVRFPP
jgi:hypothetical protein